MEAEAGAGAVPSPTNRLGQFPLFTHPPNAHLSVPPAAYL